MARKRKVPQFVENIYQMIQKRYFDIAISSLARHFDDFTPDEYNLLISLLQREIIFVCSEGFIVTPALFIDIGRLKLFKVKGGVFNES